MLVFGGSPGSSTKTNDTWQLTLDDNPRWDSVATGGTPPSARLGHCAVHDPVRDRMLVIGGDDGTVLADVWSLSLANPPSWTAEQPSGSPPAARRYSTAIYDSVRDRVVIYGGSNAAGIPYSDVWSLWLAPTPKWEQLPTHGTAPAGRFAHSAIYDPNGDRMIVFSGGGFATNDVWSLRFADSTWTLLHPLGTPPLPRFGHTADYDPFGARMVVFGGNTSNQPLNDAWELSLSGTPSWSLIVPTGEVPTPRGYHSAVHDLAHHRIVVFGGFPNVTEPTWALPLDAPVQWSPFRPVNEVSSTDLHFPIVTVGDTIPSSFSITNVGMVSLQVSSMQLSSSQTPAQQIDVDPPAPRTLVWRDSVSETLSLAASVPGVARDTLLIATNDPVAPTKRVILDIDVRALDFDTAILGSPAEAPLGAALNVIVTPKPQVHIERGVLCYRIRGTSDFDSLALTSLATDFITTIPASAVTERGLEYYVRVENGDFKAFRPPGAPAVLDTQAVARPSTMVAIPRPLSGPDFLSGRDIKIEMELPDGAGFQSGTIHYRQGGEQVYSSGAVSLDEQTGRPFAVIPGGVAGSYGVEYWVEVQTFRTTLRYPANGADAIRIKVQDLVEPPPQHPAGRYRLLTVPLDFGVNFAGSLDALLTDQLGPYDPVQWRAYVYDAAAGNIEFAPTEAARFRPEPGRGFWLISRSAHRVDTQPIDGLSTRTSGDYPIVLAQGWNLFGNPFDFPVEWSSVRVPALTGMPAAFDPSRGTIGDYADVTPSVLEPFEGYFIKYDGAAPDTMWVSPIAAPIAIPIAAPLPTSSNSAPATHTDPGSWRLRLRATTDRAADGANDFGLDRSAEEGRDPQDLPKPPMPPGPWVRVGFVHPEWGDDSGPYRRDLRRPGTDGETWEVEVRSATLGEAVTLDLSDIVAAPTGTALRLIDREQGSSAAASLDAATAAGAARLRYTIVSMGDRPYRLELVAGTAAYVSNAVQQTLSIPTRITLDQSPNPFRFATRIRFGLPQAGRVSAEVYSILGQRVARLLEGASLPAGYHSLVWDGSTGGTRTAASGVYLLRLTTDDGVLTKRVIRVR
jgi:hypothetical protein